MKIVFPERRSSIKYLSLFAFVFEIFRGLSDDQHSVSVNGSMGFLFCTIEVYCFHLYCTLYIVAQLLSSPSLCKYFIPTCLFMSHYSMNAHIFTHEISVSIQCFLPKYQNIQTFKGNSMHKCIKILFKFQAKHLDFLPSRLNLSSVT